MFKEILTTKIHKSLLNVTLLHHRAQINTNKHHIKWEEHRIQNIERISSLNHRTIFERIYITMYINDIVFIRYSILSKMHGNF